MKSSLGLTWYSRRTRSQLAALQLAGDQRQLHRADTAARLQSLDEHLGVVGSGAAD